MPYIDMRKEASTDPNYNQLRNGVKFGFWQHLTHDKKVTTEGSYDENGDRTGHWISYFPNGKVQWAGDYLAHRQIGHWIHCNELGEIVYEFLFIK